MKILSLFSGLPLVILIHNSVAYDLNFNTDKDASLWKFNGSYLYSKRVQNLAPLLPTPLLRSEQQQEIARNGVWLAKYGGPEADNYLSLGNTLNHHLFSQAWVHLIASPSVPLIVSTNGNEEIGKFWSDGKTWCDAVVKVNLHNSVKFEMYTPNPGDYAMIDRIVLGVMSNISMLNGRELTPCSTLPVTVNDTENVSDSMTPDMMQKSPSRGHHHHMSPVESPPDMINKPPVRTSQSPHTPPDMRTTRKPGMTTGPNNARVIPNLDTSTVTNDDPETTSNDSSEVKCGCSCSCSRVKTKKNTPGMSNVEMASG